MHPTKCPEIIKTYDYSERYRSIRVVGEVRKSIPKFDNSRYVVPNPKTEAVHVDLQFLGRCSAAGKYPGREDA